MTFRTSVERYLGAVAQQYRRGDAREESYYDVLKQLWEELRCRKTCESSS